MSKKFYITTPIYYVNDVPHIGHAYTTIAADVLARYKRLIGQEVFFLTGTDEHGEKIMEAAAQEGISPQEFVDKIVPRFQETWEKLDIKYDDFIRTTEERHIKVVQKMFEKMIKKGDIYKGEYEDWYCVSCETYFTETQLSIEGKCPDCDKDVKKVKEETYFFKLSKYEKPLLDLIEKNPSFIEPESRRNEVLNFIKQGLKDLSVSRTTFDWGVPLPNDKKHVTYVWFDALINYTSAAGLYLDDKKFKTLWPADVHIIGKEITRFHAIIWPAMLLSCGVEPPKMVFGHGWWTVEGNKMSKSAGNVVDPLALVEEFGVDATRYFLLREIPFGKDGDFSIKNFKLRFNTDLANDLGNLLNRTLSMSNKYFEGKVPQLNSNLNDLDQELTTLKEALPQKIDQAMTKLQFSVALEAIWEVIGLANKYIERSAPWTLSKENKQAELQNVIAILIDCLREIAKQISPFMPKVSDKIIKQLQASKPEPIFPRLEI